MGFHQSWQPPQEFVVRRATPPVVPAAAGPEPAAEADEQETAPDPRDEQPVPTRARPRSKEPVGSDRTGPGGQPRTEVRPAVTVPGLGDDGWRETAAAVDRLLGDDGRRARLRAVLEQQAEERTQRRLQAAVPLARSLLEEVAALLERVERQTPGAGASTGPASVDPPGGTLRIARDFPWPDLLERHGKRGDADCLAAARAVQQALRTLAPDDLASAHAALRQDLRRLRRALREVDRSDRPLSRRRLVGLLTAALRVAETIAIGVLAAAVTAVEEGKAIAAAAFTAGVGLAVSASCEEAVRLVRGSLRPPSPVQRLRTAHEELAYVVDDLVQLLTDGAGRRRAEDTYVSVLALSHHARHLAGLVDWPRSAAYVSEVDELVLALAPAMAAARATDRAALRAALPALAAAGDAVAAHRLPPGG